MTTTTPASWCPKHPRYAQKRILREHQNNKTSQHSWQVLTICAFCQAAKQKAWRKRERVVA